MCAKCQAVAGEPTHVCADDCTHPTVNLNGACALCGIQVALTGQVRVQSFKDSDYDWGGTDSD